MCYQGIQDGGTIIGSSEMGITLANHSVFWCVSNTVVLHHLPACARTPRPALQALNGVAD